MAYTMLTEEKVRKIADVGSLFGNESLAFLRENCKDLKFSSGEEKDTFHFERDVDRYCLENAMERFLKSGARDDAFDVYVCYCEIFQPFGKGYDSVRYLVELLAEHETNSSSLLMKHRDHYTHSVYVFALGLCIYRNNQAVRNAYNKHYHLTEEGGNHFLEYWGLSALFHDIGYPFEIAHQQMKVYACTLQGISKNAVNDVPDYFPVVSYKGMADFTTLQVGEETVDLNQVLAREISEKLGKKYEISYEAIHAILSDRATFDNYDSTDPAQPVPYLYLDHAYFSGLILAQRHLSSLSSMEELDQAKMDAITAVTLHNSLFKYRIKGKNPCLDLGDDMPLAYLLMLCDELQCWNRISFGQNSRSDVYPFGFDLKFDKNTISCTYFYDSHLEEKAKRSKSYQALQGENKDGQFKKDIQGIVDISRDVPVEICADFKEFHVSSASYMSNTNYLNLYDFALVLNARYALEGKQLTVSSSKEEIIALKEEMVRLFEKLSLEFKLSNIGQAKGFAKHLNAIGCYYTHDLSQFERIEKFTPSDLEILANLEHTRWMEEKTAMGWVFGTEYKNKEERDFKRIHKDIVPFEQLSAEDKAKDSEPMKFMLELMSMFDGLRIYRTDKTSP